MASPGNVLDDIDLTGVRPAARRWFLRVRLVFGVLATVGAIAFVFHAILFHLAFRSGAPAPAGDKTFRIADHADVAYVTHGAKVALLSLGIVMFAGLGIGGAGLFATEALIRFIQRRGQRVLAARKGAGKIESTMQNMP
jgi:hypothetical protein